MFCTSITNTSAIANANNLAVSTRLVLIMCVITDGDTAAAALVVVLAGVVGCELSLWGGVLELIYPFIAWGCDDGDSNAVLLV